MADVHPSTTRDIQRGRGGGRAHVRGGGRGRRRTNITGKILATIVEHVHWTTMREANKCFLLLAWMLCPRLIEFMSDEFSVVEYILTCFMLYILNTGYLVLK